MRIEKSWGFEEILYNGEYCCKLLVYTRRIASSLHYHEKKHETFYVSRGTFELDDGTSSRRLNEGDSVVLAPLTRHRLTCVEPGTILESSTHDDPEDCVRIIPSDT